MSFSSCSDNDEERIQPSTSSIAMEGEGGETKVALSNGDWHIAAVINKNGNTRIYGEALSLDGKIISENSCLELAGLGELNALWSEKGFRIIRDEPTSMRVIVEENYTEEIFSFAIILQSGEETKEIIVKQKVSQGYKFDKIEYTLKEGDGDSLYVVRGASFHLDLLEPREISFPTINDLISSVNQSYFESNQSNAFLWMKNDLIMVEVPSNIYDGTVYCNGEKKPYSNSVTTVPYDSGGFTKTIQLPAGHLIVNTEIQYRRRRISYILTLVNNRTKEKKSIEGKWIETTPTEEYTINLINNN